MKAYLINDISWFSYYDIINLGDDMMPKRKTHEEYLQEVFELVGSEYKVTSEYQGHLKPIQIRHMKCDFEFETTPRKFTGVNKCPRCTHEQGKSNARKTHNQFLTEVHALVGNEYEINSVYINNKTKIKFHHKICGHNFEMTPKDFLKGIRCPKCGRLKCSSSKRKSPETFLKEFDEIWNGEYTLLTEYEVNRNKVKVVHNNDSCKRHVFFATPNNLINKQSGCPKCAGTLKQNTKEFKQEVYELVGHEYEVKGKYENSKKKIQMLHNTCGFLYDVTPEKFKFGRRCPKCNESLGERFIADCLDSMNLPYKREFTFEKCRFKKCLPFDFVVFMNEEILALIEFDGRQHFSAIDYFGGEEGFKLTQQRDEIKSTFCKQNNIPLIRIPFWDIDKIENILKEHLQS